MSRCPVCGRENVYMFRDQACKYCRTDAFLKALNSQGIPASVMPDEDPDAPRHSFFDKIGFLREALIRVEKGSIQFIELWRTDTRNVTWFTVAYLARIGGDVAGSELKASLGEAFSVWHERKPLKEYRWEGGSLAQTLSADPILKEALTPNESQLETYYESKGKLAVITEVVGDHYPDPERKHFEAIERVMDHMRELAMRDS